MGYDLGKNGHIAFLYLISFSFDNRIEVCSKKKLYDVLMPRNSPPDVWLSFRICFIFC